MLKVLITTLFAMGAFAVSDVKIVKVLDGKVKFCKSRYDVFTGRLGTYEVQVKNLAVTENVAEVELELKFKRCVGDKEVGFNFVEVSPYEEVSFQSLALKNEEPEDLRIIPTEVKLRGYKDGVYKNLFENVLNRDSIQTITLEFPVSEAFDKEITDEKSGASKTRFAVDIFVLKKSKWENLSKGEGYSDQKSLGAYRLFFHL